MTPLDLSPVNNSIPIDLKRMVFCVGIREGGEVEWDFMWDQMIKSTSASEQTEMRQALACTNQQYLLKASNYKQ